MLCFATLEAALFGAHVVHGGLYTDDWAYASIQHQLGTFGLFENLVSANHDRPLAALYQSLTTAVSGTNPHIHALWGLLTLLVAATAIYLLLRDLSLGDGEAIVIVLLFIAFPFDDSASLWYAASHSYLAIAFAAFGGRLAIAGLQRSGWSAVSYHGAACLLFAVSILTYQVAAGVICLSILIYLGRLGCKRAFAFWILDLCVVVLALTTPRLITGSAGATADPIIPFGEQVDHLKLMGDQGLTLLTAILVPFGGPHRNVVLPIALVTAGFGCVVAWRGGAESGQRRQMLRWLGFITIGAMVVAVAYIVYLPAPISLYQPLGKGEENRVNVMASLGYALIVYGLAMVLATTVTRFLRRRSAWASVLGAALVAGVLVGYFQRVRMDVTAWDRAGSIQRQQLRELRAMGRPPRSSTIYAFGGIGATAPGVYSFRVTWDLNSAVQLLWNDATLRAYPIFAGTQMSCGRTQVVPVGPANGDGPGQAAYYGHAIFYDFATGREQHIDNEAECAEGVAAFPPEPVEV